MKRLPGLTILFWYALVSGLMAQVTPPQIAYIIPDIGTPGMNTYVEIIAPYNYFGKFGTADGMVAATALTIKFVNAADSNRILVSPTIVSWDGRLLSCQFFVKPWAALGPVPFRVQTGTSLSNVDTFFIVSPQSFGSKTGGGVIGSGGTWGTRSRRGAMLVDSLVLSSGTYTVSTNDPDPYSTGNQGYLPLVLLSKGRVVINSGATLNVSASGKNGGPGGGGGGGFGSGSLIPGGGERDLPLGDGYAAGKHPVITTPPIGGPTGGDGTGTGNGGASLNGVTANSTFNLNRLYAAGPGHPFDNDGRSGGAGAIGATGFTYGTYYGGGGNATAGTGITTVTSVNGQVIGNQQIIPLHGGGGGASGGANDYVGAGGGGAISLYSRSEAIVSSVRASGADGSNSCSGCGTGSGDGSGGGAGGSVIIGAKQGLTITTVNVDSGKGGTSSNTATVAGNGGIGRFRNDGRTKGHPTVAFNASRYAGPTLDTLTYADSAQWTVRGTGRYRPTIGGDTIQIFVAGENSPFNIGNVFTTVVGSDSTWSRRIAFPFDSAAYIFVVQKTDDPGTTSQFTRIPSHVTSQAAANIVRLNLFPILDAPLSSTIDTVVCPASRYDTIVVRNRGTGLLVLGQGTGFIGTESFLYTMVQPSAIPDTIQPLDSVAIVVRFNGISATNGPHPVTLRLMTNDPNSRQVDIAIRATKETRKFSVKETNIDLGTIYVGMTRDTSSMYKNLNTFRDSITEIRQLSGYAALTRPLPAVLPRQQRGGDSVQIVYHYAPLDTGRTIALFKLFSFPCLDSALITVQGYARSAIITSKPIWDLSGLACSDTAIQDFTIRNTGNAPLILQEPSIIGPDASSFALLGTTPSLPFPQTVAIGDSVIFRMRVASSSTAPLLAQLRVQHNDSTKKDRPFHYIDLSADRDPITLSAVDTIIDFGTLCIGGNESVAKDVQLTNLSHRSRVRIDSLGRTNRIPSFVLAPASYPMDLAAQTGTSIGVTFKPTTVGVFNDTLIIYSTPACGDRLRLILRGTGVNGIPSTDLATIAFGDIRVGSPSQRVITLRNANPDNSPPIIVDKLRITPATPQLSILWPVLPPQRTLAPGDTMQVTVQYFPTSAAKLPAASLCADVVSPCSTSVCKPITGNGIISSVATSKNELDLSIGSCSSATWAEDTLSVFNYGNAPLDVTNIVSSSALFSVTSPSPPSFTIGAGGQRLVTVRYTPTASGVQNAKLTFSTSDQQRPSFDIDLTGRHDTVGLTVSSPSLDFGALQGCQLPAVDGLRIRNVGSIADTVWSIGISAPFDVSPAPPYIIPPGKDTLVNITFRPATDGVFSSSMTISSSPCAESRKIDLAGTRLTPSFTVPAVNFGDVKVGTPGGAAATITNGNSFAVRIASARVTPASSEVQVTPGQFPITIPAGGSGSIALTYTPQGPTPIPSTLQLEITVDSLCGQTLTTPISGEGIEGGVGLNKRELSYGKILDCRSGEESLIVRNIGTARLELTGAAIDPGSGGRFTIVRNDAPVTLVPGDSATVVVRFTPGAGTAGPESGTLRLTTDDPDRPEILIPLTGERIVESIVFAGPGVPPTPVGASSAITRWLVNTGSAPITIDALSVPPPFSITGTSPTLPATLLPGDSIAVDLVFAPQTNSDFADSLTVEATAACATIGPFPLDGSGDGEGLADITLPTVVATPGEHLALPLMLRSSSNLDRVGAHQFTATVRFNQSILFPTDSTPFGIREGRQRSISLSGTRPTGMESGTLAFINLIAALGDTTSTPLDITDVTWRDSRVTTTTESGQVSIKTEGGWRVFLSTGRMALDPIRPSPAQGMVTIEYETIEQGRTRLLLMDLLGRSVITIVDANLAPARYTIMYDTGGLPSGLYYCVLQTPSGQITRPVHVIR